jgi:DNA-binding NtrC family response regulator
MHYTILVIDEEPAERAVLCAAIREKLNYRTLELDGASVPHCPADGHGKPDIILYDISKLAQPYEKVAGIKTAYPETPLIVLAQYGDYEGAMTAINAGAQDFLMKPVAIERMNVTFRNILVLCGAGMADGKGKNYAENIMMFSLLADDGNIRRMHEIEQEAIRLALRHYDWRMTEVARRLGIGRSTLYRKLQETSLSETA